MACDPGTKRNNASMPPFPVQPDEGGLLAPRGDADYASLRVLGRTTIGKSFPLKYGHPDDVGSAARTVWQIVAEDASWEGNLNGEVEDTMLHESPGGRVQVKARVVHDAGRVVEIRFERVTGRANDDAAISNLLNLDEAASRRLISLCLTLQGVDPSGTTTLKFDEGQLAAVLEAPEAVAAAYAAQPERFKAMIESDVSAQDVIAIAARRRTLERFEELMNSPEAFSEARAGGSAEAVWQRFFEDNPWLLGVGLAGHLLTAWDPERLERVVAGYSVGDVGKRVDALMTTNGLIRSLVFAELKLHDDDLVEAKSAYRPGTWSPSRALVGGVTQSLVTIQRARDTLGEWLSVRDPDGYRTGEQVFSGAPRSFLVVGRLDSLAHDGDLHPEKVRSFELFRRNLSIPEIVTYDEVLARAKWALDLDQGSAGT